MATEIKKIISRRDTAAQWEKVNPILRLCEIGLVIDVAGRVTGMKIGSGALGVEM